VPPVFMVVSMVISTRLVVLTACSMILVISPSTVVFSTLLVVFAACSTTLVISPPTVVLLALILPSSKLRDNNCASVATGRGGDGKDYKLELPYSMLSLLPMVIAMSPLGKTLAPLVVAGCMATATGRFGSVVSFAVALAGVPCSKRLHLKHRW
jgi:hypothetical protein